MAPARSATPPDDLIGELYQAILRRDPDPAGLREHAAMLERDPEGLMAVIRSLTASAEYGVLAAAPAAAAAGPARFTNDTSQFGELEILLKLWVNRAARHRFVVDVGARGRERSNSYDLLRVFGWKGVLIEANPALIGPIRRDFAGLDIDLINCAVSDYDGIAEFHIGVNDDVSSLDSAAAQGWGDTKGSVRVPVRRLGPLLVERGVPRDFDLLSLDIEGEDIKVLNDLVGRDGFRPAFIIIEASYDFQTKSLADLPLLPEVQGAYAILGQTAANLILGPRER